MANTFILEVIAFNISSCIDIQRAGAQRIELCDNPAEGGTTPSYGFIKAARKAVDIELFPMIRPRGGDFVYSPEEFEIMKDDVIICKDLGCNGIVFGMLAKDGSIDINRCSKIIELAYPMSVTFHRAFDRVKDINSSLDQLIEIGCERVLTSGGRPTAIEGAAVIADLISQAADRIIVMPGSGIRPGNILGLAKTTGAQEFHTSARSIIKSQMEYISPGIAEDAGTISVNETEVKMMIQVLGELNLQHANT